MNGFGCFWVKVVNEAFGGGLITHGECLKEKEKPKGGILIKSIGEVIYKEGWVNEGKSKDIEYDRLLLERIKLRKLPEEGKSENYNKILQSNRME